MSADHTDRLAEHARHRHHDTVRRAHEALAELANTGQSVTIARLADKAGVSRSWIYTQPELRERVEQLQRRFTEAGANRATVTRASDESLRSRLAVAHERNTQLRRENQQLRESLAHAHGQLRAARGAT